MAYAWAVGSQAAHKNDVAAAVRMAMFSGDISKRQMMEEMGEGEVAASSRIVRWR